MFSDSVLTENSVRLLCFVSVLSLMLFWQKLRPVRKRNGVPMLKRFSTHLALSFLGGLVVRLILPLSAVQFAVLCSSQSWGLFAVFPVQGLLAFVLSVVLLDCAIYWQHVWFHRLPWLWRLHQVHHSDTEFEVTTGIRFHPIEILLSMLLKFSFIALLGAPAIAVLTFEILLNAASLFTHANMSLGQVWDARIRRVFVTPDMHRIHHSIHVAETDSNFGFLLSVWDRWFGSYTAQSQESQATMDIGLEYLREPERQSLRGLLVQPLSSNLAD